MTDVTLHHGDCIEVMRELPDCSVDAVCTDPPYGLEFMGKEWDSGKSFVERKAAKSNTFDHVGGNAEKAEIVRRWVEGGGSIASICQRMGWHDNRYKDELEVAS